MTRTAISTPDAPKAIGPYSQAILVDGFVFCAGQLGVDPATGQAVEGGIVAQTERALGNLRAVLGAAGCTFADVVKTTVFLTDLGDFQAMNEIYATFMTDPFPARSTVPVAALAKGSLIEIEAIARQPGR
jgi:2-iminobutanoate/2-iminopropanoate deaminase